MSSAAVAKSWTFATQNPHKLTEAQALLPNFISLKPLPAGLPTAPEPHATLYENALAKARFYAGLGFLPLIVEDSGLFVPALGGLPGVHSAHYGGPSRLLEAMKDLSQRQAYFVAVVLAYEGPHTYRFFTGVWWGQIASQAAGTEGFGYDPVFIPEGAQQTVAQLGPAYKAQHSHRSQAFRKFAAWLSSYSSP